MIQPYCAKQVQLNSNQSISVWPKLCWVCLTVGRYEWPPSAYKHFYFNSTQSTLAIWLVVVVGIILLYECIRYIVPLVYYSRCLLRREMLALFVSSLYPHYYGWWGLINYINEDFYAQWKHQVCICSLHKWVSNIYRLTRHIMRHIQAT